jgi:hypothetical protein
MRKAILFLTGLALLNACTSSKKNPAVKADSTTVHDSLRISKTATIPVKNQKCEAGDTLIYGDSVFNSYTEDKMRGSGVVSFQMDVNDRLDIFYPDGATFGYLVYNEDGTFYTTSMPAKLVARWVVPAADFAQFDFDAEAVDTDKDYLIIYANKKKLKVKKAGVKYTFSKWEDYIRSATIQLKDCNLLEGAAQYRDMSFDVIEVDGDRIKVKSSKDCSGPDVKFKPLEGWLTWKKDGNLLVDFGICD